jgi:hypothetical protein
MRSGVKDEVLELGPNNIDTDRLQASLKEFLSELSKAHLLHDGDNS